MTTRRKGRAGNLIVSCECLALDEFESAAHDARELGATHVVVSHLPFSRWLLDGSPDLYPSWSMLSATIFKLVVPGALEGYLPAEPARENMELVAERCRILRGLGLKATFGACEPMWLPEEVYRAHPDWRGPQCELPCIARRPYWAPCIDNPEVLALYRESVRELCRRAPEIELIDMFTNDSGSGVCWSEGLYPGVNGPASCRGRGMGERVVGFLSALQEGAREAGREVMVRIGLAPQEAGETRPLLKPGQACGNVAWDGGQWSASAGYGWFGSHLWPMLGISQPFRLAEEAQAAAGIGAANVTLNLERQSREFMRDLFRAYQDRPAKGWLGRVRFLQRFASERYGAQSAADMVEAWHHIDTALTTLRLCGGVGFGDILLVVTSTQRWLTRPLVPNPMCLTREEKEHYQRHVFTADPEEVWTNFQVMLGRHEITGYKVGGILANTEIWVDKARRCIGRALERADANGGAAEELRLLDTRLHLLRLVLRNGSNCINYQDTLQYVRADYLSSAAPGGEGGEVIGAPGERELRRRVTNVLAHWKELRDIARDEIDNTGEIIRLLTSSAAPERLIALAPTPEDEDVFSFAPDLVEHLGKKVEIMMSHWPEYDSIYPTF